MTDQMFSVVLIKKRQAVDKFAEKNKDVLKTIKGGELLSDLNPKQFSTYMKEHRVVQPLIRAQDKHRDSQEMYFIRLWLEFESYQIDLLTNFLLSNEDSLKTLVAKLSKKKKIPGLKSSYWISYFEGELREAGRARYVRDLVGTCTRGGVIDRQSMFALIGVKISGIENDSIILLQKIRNMIIHEKSILSDDVLVELREFVKKYSIPYNKHMRKLADIAKEKKISDVESVGHYIRTDDVVYRTFKLLLKNVQKNKKNKKTNKIDFHENVMERCFKIILKDFFNKTYQILKLSNFDFSANEKREWGIVSLDNQKRQNFLYEYLTSFGEFYRVESENISNTKKTEKNRPSFFLRGIQSSNLFRMGKDIFLEHPIIGKDGQFIDKHKFQSENLNKVNLLALNYYNRMILSKTFDDGNYPKDLRNFIIKTPTFKSIKHNESSKSFSTEIDSKSLNLDFKIAKLLLLGQFTDAVETLYDCEDLTRENLDSIRSGWGLALELDSNIDFIELLKSYGVMTTDDKDELIVSAQDIENKFEA